MLFMRPPAFQFYPDDFVSGVSTMTQSEVGAYILLLCHQWSVGKISSEVDRMEIVAKGKISEHVLEKFPRGKNRRLEFERQKQQLFRESRSQNGKLGGRPRKASEKLVLNSVKPTGKATESSPSPSPSPSPSREGERARECREIPTEAEAVGLTMTAGIPEAFTRYVYTIWAGRSGKDGAGVLVDFLPYVVGRWKNEQTDWKARTHKGNKAPVVQNGKPYLDPHRPIGNESP